VIAYRSNWDDEFSVEFVCKTVEEIKGSDEYRDIDPSELTQEECDELGFAKWDEEGLMLIPLWLVPYISETFEGACITDPKFRLMVTSKQDNDHRYGCVSFGVYCND